MGTCAIDHQSTGSMACTYPNGFTSQSSIGSLEVGNAQVLSDLVGFRMWLSGWLIGFVGWCLWCSSCIRGNQTAATQGLDVESLFPIFEGDRSVFSGSPSQNSSLSGSPPDSSISSSQNSSDSFALKFFHSGIIDASKSFW
jgi:hypothetical protein